MHRIITLTLLAALTLPGLAESPLTKQLPGWWREAEDTAAKVPAEERKARQRAITHNPAPKNPEEAIRVMLLAIALRPQDVSGAEQLIIAARNIPVQDDSNHFQAARTFVDELYARYAGTATEEQVQWQSGRSEFLLTLGRWKEALPLQREVVARNDDTYKKVMLAVIEKLNGDDEPFAKIMADCPSRPGEADCRVIANTFMIRMSYWLGDKLPLAAREIMAGRGVARPEGWEERIHGLTILAHNLPKAADPELQALVAAPEAPAYVKDDAVFLMASLTRRTSSHQDIGPLVDCWFLRRKAEFPLMSPEGWEQLREIIKMPPILNVPPDFEWGCLEQDAYRAVPLDLSEACVGDLLFDATFSAVDRKDELGAKQIVERAVALSLALGRPIRRLDQILDVAASRFNNARVMQYVGSLQYPYPDVEPWTPEIRAALRKQTQRVSTPWDSPVKAPSRATADCLR
jgi:hypothetical protein